MFKVGDKVRVVGRQGLHYHRMGDILTITRVNQDTWDGHTHYETIEEISRLVQSVQHRDLMLVATRELPPTNLKSADDVIISGVTFEQAIKDDILLMAHLYHKGLSFRDVAKLTNVHERTVRRRFKRYGIPSRAPKGVK